MAQAAYSTIASPDTKVGVPSVSRSGENGALGGDIQLKEPESPLVGGASCAD
jgi:hypothetical protein